MTSHEYEDVEMDNCECPECGSENIVRNEPVDGGPPVPTRWRGRCRGCGHKDKPLRFSHEYRLNRLDEAERRRIRERTV